MDGYLIARKVIQDAVLIVFIVIILFVVLRLMPGSPATMFLHGLKNPTPAQEARIEKELGLAGGKFSFSAFIIYLKDMFTFNFGDDYATMQPVMSMISQALPYTLILFATAAVLSFIIGIPLGFITAFIRKKKVEGGIISFATILNAVPFFVTAIVLFLYFAAYLHWFPLRAIFPISDIVHPTFASLGNALYHLAMPLIVLVVIESMGHMLTSRAAMVSVLGEDFITTARAVGVPERDIVLHHAGRNAMIPISTRMALEFPFLMSGAVIVGIIFDLPGMGIALYHATLSEDYPFTEGALFIISLIVILMYSMVDFIHAWMDPRIKV